ncbi:hypothetical protein RRG08_015274 [Elysia crispata]|uniref:GON domain-containing protein n=1 Tax=Elysia crispata TaxID=231223 RepID=A0AAE1ASZ6_9GAST|nr:hypothetical protein RRG08_015274 [Elysia crispata]
MCPANTSKGPAFQTKRLSTTTLPPELTIRGGRESFQNNRPGHGWCPPDTDSFEEGRSPRFGAKPPWDNMPETLAIQGCPEGHFGAKADG